MFELKISTLTDSFEIKLETLVPSLAQATGRDSYYKQKVDSYVSVIEYLIDKNEWRNLKGKLTLYGQEYVFEEMHIEEVIHQLKNVVKILEYILYKSPYTSITDNVEFTTTRYEVEKSISKYKFDDFLKFFNPYRDLLIVTNTNDRYNNYLDWKMAAEKAGEGGKIKLIKYENYGSQLIISQPSTEQFQKLFIAHLNIAKEKHAIK